MREKTDFMKKSSNLTKPEEINCNKAIKFKEANLI